jgi:flagellar biosynthetic protein FliO
LPAASVSGAESPRPDTPAADSESRPGGYLAEFTDEPDLPTAAVGTSVLEAVAALFLVLALIGGAVWLIRRFMGPRFLTSRRAEGIRVLATRPLGSRHGLLLVEAGGLVWLLSQSPDGARLVAEISDPEALRRLDDRYDFLEAPFESELRRQLDESPGEAPANPTGAGEEAPEPSSEERLAALRRRPRPGGRG